MAETVIAFSKIDEHVLGDDSSRSSESISDVSRETNAQTTKTVMMVPFNSNEFGYEPIYRDNSPVCLSWENLTVKTKPKKGQPEGKVLLDNLSGMITGGLWAIMGPSGSGDVY